MKRKFKITLIAISILSILFAFAITSSASNYIDISSVTMEGFNGGMFTSYSNFYGDFTSTAGEEFGVITFDHSGGSSLGFVNIEFWDSYMSSKNVNSPEDFLSAVREMVDIGYLIEYSEILSMVEMSPSSFYNVYSSYKAQQLNQFSQNDLDFAVSKALAEAGLALTDDTVVYIIQSTDYNGSFGAAGGSLWTFGDYTLYYLSEGSIGFECIVVNGAKAFYSDITANVEDKTLLFDYFVSKNENFSSESWLIYPSVSEGLYNCVADALVEVPSPDDLQAKYNEGYSNGKVAGVEDFKKSDEFKAEYLNGYSTGIEEFKQSDAYTNALDLQYANGKVAGAADYKASSEYSNALKSEYDDGYKAGVTDTQDENTKNSTTRLIGILIGVLGFGIFFMAVLSGIGSFKKKRAKRR